MRLAPTISADELRVLCRARAPEVQLEDSLLTTCNRSINELHSNAHLLGRTIAIRAWRRHDAARPSAVDLERADKIDYLK